MSRAAKKSQTNVIDTGTVVKIKAVVVAIHINHIKGSAVLQIVARGQHNSKGDETAAIKLEVTRTHCELFIKLASAHEKVQFSTGFHGKCLQISKRCRVHASGGSSQIHRSAAIDCHGIRAAAKRRSPRKMQHPAIHRDRISTPMHIKITRHPAAANGKAGGKIPSDMGIHKVMCSHIATLEIDDDITRNRKSSAPCVVSIPHPNIRIIGNGRRSPRLMNKHSSTASTITTVWTEENPASIDNSDSSTRITIARRQNFYATMSNIAVGSTTIITNLAAVGDTDRCRATRISNNSPKVAVEIESAIVLVLSLNKIAAIVNGESSFALHMQCSDIGKIRPHLLLGATGLKIDRHPASCCETSPIQIHAHDMTRA